MARPVTEFAWPWQHGFPPFYTIQPNSDTRSKQLEAWTSLILSYCKHHKIHQMDVAEIANSELFSNKTIQRKFSVENIVQILDVLASRGHVEWIDPKKKSCLIMWRTPEEWGKLLYDWAVSAAMTNTVCTFYELTSGEDTENQEFHGIEKWLLLKALRTLETNRKAEVIGDDGVKFF